jgi:hypothetical protein
VLKPVWHKQTHLPHPNPQKNIFRFLISSASNKAQFDGWTFSFVTIFEGLKK